MVLRCVRSRIKRKGVLNVWKYLGLLLGSLNHFWSIQVSIFEQFANPSPGHGRLTLVVWMGYGSGPPENQMTLNTFPNWTMRSVCLARWYEWVQWYWNREMEVKSFCFFQEESQNAMFLKTRKPRPKREGSVWSIPRPWECHGTVPSIRNLDLLRGKNLSYLVWDCSSVCFLSLWEGMRALTYDHTKTKWGS